MFLKDLNFCFCMIIGLLSISCIFCVYIEMWGKDFVVYYRLFVFKCRFVCECVLMIQKMLFVVRSVDEGLLLFTKYIRRYRYKKGNFIPKEVACDVVCRLLMQIIILSVKSFEISFICCSMIPIFSNKKSTSGSDVTFMLSSTLFNEYNQKVGHQWQIE